jgi:hypothetical protein
VRADPDFAAYVVARRPWVVRAYVLLGVPTAAAEVLASDAFADVLPGWGALRRAGDRDVEVARVVLDRWARAGVGAPRSVSVPTPRLLTSELEERLALLTRLGDGLADLQETSRLAVVLHHVLGLDVADTAAALGETPPAVEYRLHDAARTLDLGPLDTVCHDAAAAIEVAPPDLAEISARSHSDARRRWLVGGALVVALVLVATGVAALVRPEPEPHLTPLTVTKEDNTVGVAWWLGGTLHLDEGTVRVSGVRHLVEAGDDVVYGDGDGLVVAVAEDGSRVELGHMDVGTPLVSSPRAGLVAWLEPDDDGDLVVWSAAERRVVGTVPRTADTRLVGWDRERLYFSRQGEDGVLSTAGGDLSESVLPMPLAPQSGSIVDVAADVQLWTAGGYLKVAQPSVLEAATVPGTSGQLSPDGRFVITVGSPGGPAAYDAITGEAVGTWFPDDWTPMASAFTAEGRVVWSVSRVGSYTLIDCLVSRGYMNSFDVDSEPCTPRLDLKGVPVLAGGEPGLVPST